MQIINKKSTTILSSTGKQSKHITVHERQIYFSRGLCLTGRLKPGLFIHFINDGSDWKFYANDDKDGFPMVKGKNKDSFFVCSVALANMIRKSTGAQMFPVEPTMLQQGGSKVFMIMTHKPIKKG